MKTLLTLALMVACCPAARAGWAAQVCDAGKPALAGGVHSVTGTGEGCEWQLDDRQKLSAYVHFDQPKETVDAVKSMMDASAPLPGFQRVKFDACPRGELASAEGGADEGPGGLAYAECDGRVLTFSFQGARSKAELLPLARRLAATKFQR